MDEMETNASVWLLLVACYCFLISSSVVVLGF